MADEKLPGDIVESISIANAKSIAEQPWRRAVFRQVCASLWLR